MKNLIKKTGLSQREFIIVICMFTALAIWIGAAAEKLIPNY